MKKDYLYIDKYPGNEVIKKATKSLALTRDDTVNLLGLGKEACIDLSDAELKFCWHLIDNGMNAEKAYEDCKINGKPGLKKDTIHKNAKKLMNDSRISKFLRLAVEKHIVTLSDNLDMQLLYMYLKRAFYDVATYYNDDGSVRNLSEIDPSDRCVIDGYKTQVYGKDADVSVTTLILADRSVALKTLNEYSKSLRNVEKVAITNTDDKEMSQDDLINYYANMSDDALKEIAKSVG